MATTKKEATATAKDPLKNLPTIDIKGKDYVLVKDRILAFNDAYRDGSIETEVTDLPGGAVRVKALVYPDGRSLTDDNCRVFVGHSEAIRGGEGVNKTAALENAETSAVGRALAMMGIGVLESIASADEVHKALGSGGTPIVAPGARQSLPGPSQQAPAEETVSYDPPTQQTVAATDAQKNLIKRLCAQKGKPVPEAGWFASLSKADASRAIERLFATATGTGATVGKAQSAGGPEIN